MTDKNGNILHIGDAIWYKTNTNQRYRALVVSTIPAIIKLIDVTPRTSIELPRVYNPFENDLEKATNGDKMLALLEENWNY